MHLKHIGIQNFRVFKDYTDFEFAPITILTGKNNAGKSSLIKFLTLMDESASKHNLETLEFDGKAGLKSFGNCIPWTSDNKTSMCFQFYFKTKYNDDQYSIKYKYTDNRSNDISSGLKGISIYNHSKNHLVFDFTPCTDYVTPGEMVVHSIQFNFHDLLHCIIEKVPSNKVREDQAIEEMFNRIYEPHNTDEYPDNIFDCFAIHHPVTIDDKEKKAILNGELSTAIPDQYKDILQLDCKIEEEVNGYIYKSNLANWLNKLSEFIAIDGINKFDDNFNLNNRFENENFKRYLSCISIMTNLIINVHENCVKHVTKWHKITPLRGSQERVYRNSSETSEIFGIAKEFAENFQSNVYSHVQITEFVQRQLESFELKGEFSIERIEGVASTFYIKKDNGDKVLLADLGFGYSQLIPIIMKICNIALSSYDDRLGEFRAEKLIIEEPEANLHPDFQSKLIDLFIDASRTFNIQFVIETHSEYLIRKLQLLTLKGVVKPKDSVIYYFNNPERLRKDEKQVIKIRTTKKGGLTDSFGSGFFDEAGNIQFDILKLSRAQNN